MDKYIFYTLTIHFILTVLLFKNLFICNNIIFPISIEGDGFGHLFKIYILEKEGIFNTWTDYWYLGYPFLLYYQPFYYYFHYIIFKLLKIVGLPIITSLSCSTLIYGIIIFILTGLLSYISFRNVLYDRKMATLMSLIYNFNHLHIKLFYPEGNFPFFFAYSFVPLIIEILFRTKYLNIKKLLKLSLGFVFIGAAHISSIFLTIIYYLISLFLLYNKNILNKSFLKKNVILALFIIVSLLPIYLGFLYYHKYANFINMQTSPDIRELFSEKLYNIIAPTSEYSNTLGLFLLPFPSLFYLISIPIILLSTQEAFDYYIKLPILNKIPPYRLIYLAFLLLLTGYISYYRKSMKEKTSYMLILLTFYTILESLLVFNLIPFTVPFDLLQVFEYVENSTRYWFVDEYPYYSLYAFSPVYTNTPTMNGWYREANPIYWEYSNIRNAILFNSTILPCFWKYNIQHLIFYLPKDEYIVSKLVNKYNIKEKTIIGRYIIVSFNNTGNLSELKRINNGYVVNINLHQYNDKIQLPIAYHPIIYTNNSGIEITRADCGNIEIKLSSDFVDKKLYLLVEKWFRFVQILTILFIIYIILL